MTNESNIKKECKEISISKILKIIAIEGEK